MKKIILAVFVLASVMASARTAPSFRGDLLTGGSLSLREALKPNRALLVCFWASWCVPCMKELKLVKEGLAANPSLPLDVITINEDTSDTAADIKPTLKLHGLNFPVILDPKKEIFSRNRTSLTVFGAPQPERRNPCHLQGAARRRHAKRNQIAPRNAACRISFCSQ
jgi:peroxiredoxin